MSNNELQTNEDYTKRQIQSSFQPHSPPQIIPPLPVIDISQVQQQQQETNNSGSTMRSDAAPFTPSSMNENRSKYPFIFDLKKYKYDYFLSNLTASFDPNFGKFSSPTGICTLNDDRLLVGNFSHDSVLLLDINGTLYEIYKDLPSPKDVLYYSSNPSQAVVATRKELVMLDLNTKKIVTRSKLQGFYPWNVQFINEHGTFAACDPSGERIVYFDKNLTQIGEWSFNEPNSDPSQTYQKIYPYAAYFFPDNTSFVLTHRNNSCQLKEYDNTTGTLKKIFNLPPALQSYSIYADNSRKCLIADKVNHQLISIDKDFLIEEYKSKSIQEPYSMTFLSNGTLCVTDWNKTFGTNGGVAILSETNLKTNQ